MDFLQNRVPGEERGSGAEEIRAVKEEAVDLGSSSGQADASSRRTGTFSGQAEAGSPGIKQEGEEWTVGVKEEPSPVQIGLGADSPAEIEVNLELGSESEESSENRPGSHSKGRKRAHPFPQQQHRKDLELTEADFELLRSMTGTPISYLANQPPLLIAVGENTYPLGSGLSYQIPSMNVFSGPQDDAS